MTAPDANPNEAGAGLSSSRRAFIGRTAAGVAAGGLVWAAPSILTLDAAAAASCGTGTHTLNWQTIGNGAAAGTYASTGGTPINVTVAAGASSPSPVSNGGGGSLGPNSFRVIADGTQIGNQTQGFWYMQMTSPATGRFLTTTFTFAQEVVGLSFSVFDIDIQSAGNTWIDLITVTGASTGGTAQIINVAKPGTGTTTLGGNGTTSATALGTTNVGQNSTNGNATFTIPTAVKTVVVRFTANAITNPIQYIGIGNLTWTSCV